MGEENGSLQSLDWNEWIGMVDWNGGIADLQFWVQRCTEPNYSLHGTGRAPGSLSRL